MGLGSSEHEQDSAFCSNPHRHRGRKKSSPNPLDFNHSLAASGSASACCWVPTSKGVAGGSLEQGTLRGAHRSSVQRGVSKARVASPPSAQLGCPSCAVLWLLGADMGQLWQGQRGREHFLLRLLSLVMFLHAPDLARPFFRCWPQHITGNAPLPVLPISPSPLQLLFKPREELL